MRKTSLLSIALFLFTNLLSANIIVSNYSDNIDYAGLNSITSQNSGTIFGQLRDKDTGLPITGAQVTITNPATGDIVFTGTTDENGDFKFDNAVQGTNYSVEYWREHFYTVTMDNVVVGAIGFKNVNAIAMLKKTSNGGIGGKVITDDEMKMSGTQMNIYPIGGTGNYNTVTDDHGMFLAPNLPSGEYNVWPSYGGSQLANSVEITVNEMLKWQVFENVPSQLNAEPGVVTFQVNAVDGSPIQNAQVTIPGVGTKFSDNEGKVELPHHPEGTYTVTAQAPDYYSDVKTVQVTAGSPVTDTFTLNPTVENQSEVSGNVRNATDNAPLEEVNVEIKFQDQSFTTTTNSSGDFKITDVPSSGSYTAKYSKPGYHTTVQKRDVEAVSKRSTIKQVTLAQKAEGFAALRLLFQSNIAIENIVEITFQAVDSDGTFSDVSGHTVHNNDKEIIITRLPANVKSIVLKLVDDRNIVFEFSVDECHMVEISVDDYYSFTREGTGLNGKVQYQNSGYYAPTVGVTLTQQPLGSLSKMNDLTETTYTNTGGNFFFDNLTPNVLYKLTFTADDANETQFLITSAEENNSDHYNIFLAASSQGTGAVTGVVYGLGLTQHAVIQTSGASTTTLEDNSYLLENIPPGDYLLSATFGGTSKEVTVTIENGITKQINFDFNAESLTSVERIGEIIPSEFALFQNYPNPFNPNTIITFSLPDANNISLEVFDALGRSMGKLVEGYLNAGKHEITFDGKSYPSGVYFYQFKFGKNIMTKKMLLIK